MSIEAGGLDFTEILSDGAGQITGLAGDGNRYILIAEGNSAAPTWSIGAKVSGGSGVLSTFGTSPTNQLGATGGAGGPSSLRTVTKRSRNSAGVASAGVASAGGGNSSSSSSSSSAAAPSSSAASSSAASSSTAEYLEQRRRQEAARIMHDSTRVTSLAGSGAVPATPSLSPAGRASAILAGCYGTVIAMIQAGLATPNIVEAASRSGVTKIVNGGITSLGYTISPSDKFCSEHMEIVGETIKTHAETSMRTGNEKVQQLLLLMIEYVRLQKANIALSQAQKDTSELGVSVVQQLTLEASLQEENYKTAFVAFAKIFSEDGYAKVAIITDIGKLLTELKRKYPHVFSESGGRQSSQMHTSGIITRPVVLNSKAVLALVQTAIDAKSISGESIVDNIMATYFPPDWETTNSKVPVIAQERLATVSEDIANLLKSPVKFYSDVGEGKFRTLFGTKKRRVVAASTAAAVEPTAAVVTRVAEIKATVEAQVASVQSSISPATIDDLVSSEDGGVEEVSEEGEVGAELMSAASTLLGMSGGSNSSSSASEGFEEFGGGARRTRIRKNRKSQKKVRKVKKQVRKTRHHKKRSTRRR